MKAISEGTEVTAQDTLTTQRQLEDHQVKVWIYNSQNATPAIQHLNALAQAQHIPIATITETLSPATASFQQWQVAQLRRIERALHRGDRPMSAATDAACPGTRPRQRAGRGARATPASGSAAGRSSAAST